MKLGLLDRLDILLGRFSDSDSPTGHRRRSWGATVLFWCCVPMVVLVLSLSVSLVVSSFCERPSSPTTKPVAKTQATLAKKQGVTLDVGPWPFAGCGLLVLIGAAFALLRREQDFARFKEAAQVLSQFAGKGTVPPSVVSAFTATASKITGEPIPPQDIAEMEKMK
jgi:ABC-type Fe3+ transport system permease subunit